MLINPWDARVNSADLAALRTTITGATVTAVRYVVPHGESWPDGHGDDRVHEVDMAVELMMADGAAVVFSWAMRGPDEGLTVEVRDSSEVDINLPGDAVDVSSHVDWAPFLGESISGLTPAWHVPGEGSVEMPWSFRVDFASKLTLVVALGELKESGLSYSPDSLSVIFDRNVALSYRIPAGISSSYGNA